MKITILKHKSKNPRKLKNGDVYDSTLINWDGVEWDGVVNVDPTVSHDYQGEIIAGNYIARKRIRTSGAIVWELETEEGKKEIPTTKPNKRHKGKSIMIAVQIHTGGRAWDGSHGCITIHPDAWYKIRKGWDDVIEVEIKETKTEEAKAEAEENKDI